MPSSSRRLRRRGHARHHLLTALLAGPLTLLALLTVLAPSARAGLGDWTPLAGLTDNPSAASIDNPEWVRTFQTGSLPLTIYAGTEGAGVWKSVNDGLTWSNFSSGLNNDSLDIYQLFTSSGNVFAATSGDLWSAPDT